MIPLEPFYRLLKEEGVEFVTGVPDTLLNDFCLGLDAEWPSPRHVLAANEGNAIALASGYHLATGTIPLVYMQNSGMGNAMNPLISLVDTAVYSIPMVLLIGWRGEPGTTDWPQHQRQGELTPVLLDDLSIPYRVLNPDEHEVAELARWAVRTARDTGRATALLVRKSVLEKKEKAGFDAASQVYTVSREEAIDTLLACAPDNSLFVATTGRATRELHALRDIRGEGHDADFLNVGAMGHALSIAAGLAIGSPDRQIICIDGDAAALMHMGSLPVTAQLPVSNLLHVVMNNGVHESVGGQSTVAMKADLTEIARHAGYKTVGIAVHTRETFAKAIGQLVQEKGPKFLEMRIRKGMRSEMPILKIAPKELKSSITKMIQR